MTNIRKVQVVIEVAADTDEEARQIVREMLQRGVSAGVAQVITRGVIGVRKMPDLDFSDKSVEFDYP